MNKKTRVYFGPPLAALTENETNTMEISGRINRTAERYLALLQSHHVDLTEPERQCLTRICEAGFLAPYEIEDLPYEVRDMDIQIEGLDREALFKKLESASFADLVAVVEDLGY